MTSAGRTGRPLQALAVLAALIIGWLAGRWPLLEREVTDAVASAEIAQRLADAPAALQRLTAVNAVAPVATMVRELAPLETPAALPTATPPVRRVAAAAKTKSVGRIVRALRWPAEPVPTETKTAAVTFVAALAPEPRPRVGSKPALLSSHQPAAFDLATSAYAELAAGHRRTAASDFDAALAVGSGDPRAPAWAQARHALTKRWSGSAYVFVRPQGASNLGLSGAFAGNAPLLGGSQSSAALAFTLDPLARQPLDLVARTTGGIGADQRQAEAAVGVRWRLLPGASLSVERLIALGPAGRRDWTFRLAGGRAAKAGALIIDGYGETGVVGIAHTTYFAAGQARSGVPFVINPALTLTPGFGVWAGIQHDQLATTDRVDAGPSMRLHWTRAKLPVDIAIDYRRRVTGNAAPGSGVAFTLISGF